MYFWCQIKLCLSAYLYNLRSDSIICFKLPFRIGAAWVLKERLVPDGEGYMCIFIKAGIGIGSSYLSDLVQQTLSLIIRLWFSIASNLALAYLLKPSRYLTFIFVTSINRFVTWYGSPNTILICHIIWLFLFHDWNKM